MTSLAADIGGTYSRLAWFDARDPAQATEQVFRNSEFGDLEAVIERGLADLGRQDRRIARIVLALPGPVHQDPVQLTNIDWRVARDSLRQRFDVDSLTIVNDFQAAAMGAVNQPYERLTLLNAATPDDGPVVVTGAGTGLGMAWLARRDDRGLPQATEGGHLDFAPNNAAQLALYRWLAERYGHVSYERVLSGDGLLDTYRSLAGDAARAASPAEITQLARQGSKAAGRAVSLFVDVFAAYAGNLALAFNPTGGIYLCGGLTVHLASWFDKAVFRTAYLAKGRMADVVGRIPVYLVTRHDTGLAGAMAISRKIYRAET